MIKIYSVKGNTNMKSISLNGKWSLTLLKSGKCFEANVPGSDYNALLACGEISDPFYADNENAALYIANEDKSFAKKFTVDDDIFEYENIVLSCKSIDTLAELYINGVPAGKSDNAYTRLELPVKDLLKAGENEIEIKITSPVNYVTEMQKKDPLPKNANGIDGVAHIRKPACHFGWDWGINMPVSGIAGDIEILAFNEEIRDFYIEQIHTGNKVFLNIKADKNLDCTGELTEPDGSVCEFELKSGKAQLTVENPLLWWTRELSGKKKQPLYEIKINNISKKIGLRTIELNRKPDKFGNNFQFILNGVPIFAKGSNVIPCDALPDRITKEAYKKITDDAVSANFNMLRIWGGGYYGADELYDLCDENGILVWQDFMFACLMYPFYNEEYLESVKKEIECNVKRIMHHPSLALWCGNNEIEFMFSYMPETAKTVKWYKKFFYEILPAEIRKYDEFTPYIETSPIGSGFRKNITADKCGDTHMWHVWHGSKNLKYYTKRFTRFCSEYGMESLPSVDCIEQFADKGELDLYSKTMLHHQKCMSGNSKMLFYLLEKYNKPDSFDDLIYLTGLTQAECVGNAAEHWRRNKGRCNGALWWQLNDCWGAPSWSSVDYYGKWKPLMYEAKRFFAPIAISVKENKSSAEVYILNDTLKTKSCRVEFKIISFGGRTLLEKSTEISSASGSAAKALKASLKGINRKECFALARLYCAGELVSQKTVMLTAERKSKLKHADIAFKLDGSRLTLKSSEYARKVFIDIKGECTPLSDNCFDLLPGEEKTVFLGRSGINENDISVKCVNNVKSGASALSRVMFRLGFSLKPENIANRIYYSVS